MLRNTIGGIDVEDDQGRRLGTVNCFVAVFSFNHSPTPNRECSWVVILKEEPSCYAEHGVKGDCR